MTHTAVIDLGYGDAGKGTVVDWLCRTQPVHAVVRFSGGAQAAHNVVLPDGRHHTFAQFGSGTFIPGVATHLSRFMLVEPLALAAEAAHLRGLGVRDPFGLLTVDEDALLTTPYHRAANQALEAARGPDAHGSCGIGVGQTVEYSLTHPDLAPRAGDTDNPGVLTTKLTALREHVLARHPEVRPDDLPPVTALTDVYATFAANVRVVDATHLHDLLRAGDVVFEGSQGVLLDEWRGFHPHTTWATTTGENVDTLLAEAGQAGEVARLGVLRTYTTRHGAGPLVTEDAALTSALPDPHNGTGRWQGAFRVGHFDAVTHRYALVASGGVDALALTHLDVAQSRPLRMASAYRFGDDVIEDLPLGPEHDLGHQERLTAQLRDSTPMYTREPADWVAAVSDALAAPVALVSAGPTHVDKRQLATLAR